MKLERWALIAEIVSGLAVITLAFLILGLRENTEVTRASAHEDLLSDVNQIALMAAQNEALSRTWQLYHEGEIASLNDSERFKLLLLLRTTFRVYETAYFANRYGTLGESEWSRFENQSCTHNVRQMQELWDEVTASLTSEFVRYLENLCP